MSTLQQTRSPIDGRIYVERTLATPQEIDASLAAARTAWTHWRAVPIDKRAAVLSRFCDEFELRREAIARGEGKE